VLESMQKPTGVVLGTFGVDAKTLIVFIRARAGTPDKTPNPDAARRVSGRRQTALACRESRSSIRTWRRLVCTWASSTSSRNRHRSAGLLRDLADQRALDPDVLAAMLGTRRRLRRARRARTMSRPNGATLGIEPRPFDPALIRLCEEAVREETGDAPGCPRAR